MRQKNGEMTNAPVFWMNGGTYCMNGGTYCMNGFEKRVFWGVFWGFGGVVLDSFNDSEAVAVVFLFGVVDAVVVEVVNADSA